MTRDRTFVPAMVLLACLCNHAQATSPEKVRVTYSEGRIYGTPPDVGVYHCDIWNILGDDRLWERSHRVTDSKIGHSIYVISRMKGTLQIWLGVQSPEHTKFSEVARAIARLKRLAEENATEDCPVEIKVFPIDMPEEAASRDAG